MSNLSLAALHSYGIPVFAAILVSVFAVVALGLFMANAGIAALIFFVVIMSFVNTGISVYNKGAGVFVSRSFSSTCTDCLWRRFSKTRLRIAPC